MAKEYTIPSISVTEIQSCQILAESLGLSNEKVHESDVLSKEESNLWDNNWEE